MKFSRIFKKSKLMWPTQIDITGGKLTDTGGNFAQLNAAWDLAEKRVTSLNEYNDLMVWAIFCGLHKLAKETLKSGGTEININKINLKYVEFKFWESLKHQPKCIKNVYINDLKL